MNLKKRNQREWRDQANWSSNFLDLYFSKRDSRVWVPKKQPWLGWTINLAHPKAGFWILGMTLIPVAFRLVRKQTSARSSARPADHW